MNNTFIFIRAKFIQTFPNKYETHIEQGGTNVSGGQRQRVGLARSIIMNPEVIIADEPIASLDVSIQAQIVNILKDLCIKKNVSLIFIAHDLSMVEYIADKILIMHLGKIVEFGSTDEVYGNPIHPYTINLFKSAPKISNANVKFESSNFELSYLEEQKKVNSYVDFFELIDSMYKERSDE